MNDEQFDQQIHDALQVEAAAGQLARLEAFWQTQSRCERRWRMGRRVVALAASLLAVAAVAGWVARQKFGEEQVVQAPQPNRVVVPESESLQTNPPQVAVAEPSPSIGRPPTAMEQFAFYSRTKSAHTAGDETLVALVDYMIQQVASGDADPQQAAELAGIAMAGVERELLPRLMRSTDSEKHTLLRLLAVCGSERSTPALLRLCRREAFRQEALAVIEQIVGVEELANVVRLSNDARVRRHFMQRMLTAGTDQAVAAYLTLVQDPALRSEALTAADGFTPLPAEVLLGFLQSDERPERLAAALVLGHVNGPEVTRLLVGLVTGEQPAPTEAWIALLSCQGELAEQFLTYAIRQPRLLGQVNHARVEWARMSL